MRNIAIIEDDGVAQKMLCDYLKRYGSEKNDNLLAFRSVPPSSSSPTTAPTTTLCLWTSSCRG